MAEYDMCALAGRYARAGWSILPAFPGTKRPCVGWKEYQTRRPTYSDWAHWRGRYGPRVNLALVTGRVSGVVAFDCDSEKARAACLELVGSDESTLWEYTTPRPGGSRLLFSIPGDLELPGWKQLSPPNNLEFFGEGGSVILPPSRTPQGTYRWVRFRGARPPELPPPARRLTVVRRPVPGPHGGPRPGPRNPDSSDRARGIKFPGATRGERNTRLFKYACALVGRGVAPREVSHLVTRANNTLDPPLDPVELHALLASAERYR